MHGPMLRPDTFALTALLAFLSSFGPLSVDLYLPSMPAIAAALAAPPAHVQLTISLYLIGFAIGQIIYGPLSDRVGRKPVIVMSFALYCVATLICLASSSIAVLVGGRFLQALGVSGAVVVVRAVVRDMYEGARAGHQLSAMGMLMGFAPIIAPLTGGVLQTAFGWRAGFLFLIAAGASAAVLAWRFLPETGRTSAALSLAGLWRSAGRNSPGISRQPCGRCRRLRGLVRVDRRLVVCTTVHLRLLAARLRGCVCDLVPRLCRRQHARDQVRPAARTRS